MPENLKLITGPAHLEDVEVVRVGHWRNPALVEANAADDSIPEYRGTYVITIAVMDKGNVDRLREVNEEGGDIRRCFITANINVNGDDNPRIPFEGEKLKAVTVIPVKGDDGEQLIHSDRSALEGRPMYRARIVEFYDAADVETESLDALLSGEETAEEDPEPVASEEA